MHIPGSFRVSQTNTLSQRASSQDEKNALITKVVLFTLALSTFFLMPALCLLKYYGHLSAFAIYTNLGLFFGLCVLNVLVYLKPNFCRRPLSGSLPELSKLPEVNVLCPSDTKGRELIFAPQKIENSTNFQMGLFSLLPMEIVLEFFSWLNVKEVMSLSRVCKAWRIITFDDETKYWETLCRKLNYLKENDESSWYETFLFHHCWATATIGFKINRELSIDIEWETYCLDAQALKFLSKENNSISLNTICLNSGERTQKIWSDLHADFYKLTSNFLFYVDSNNKELKQLNLKNGELIKCKIDNEIVDISYSTSVGIISYKRGSLENHQLSTNLFSELANGSFSIIDPKCYLFGKIFHNDFILVTCGTSLFKIYDLKERKEKGILRMPNRDDTIETVYLIGDNLALLGIGNEVQAWDLNNKKCIRRIEFEDEVKAIHSQKDQLIVCTKQKVFFCKPFIPT